ncbi:MAG: PKD domain-containing protein, partial [Flavobacteriales bacterium]|nr:PKD domain-containing protein [Flavobacteriales bacterium]
MKEDMNNPFDKQIKESLENFEMPYDASAWSALEQQLPTTTTGGINLGWKAAALVGIIATTVATALYLNQDGDPVTNDNAIVNQEEIVGSDISTDNIENDAVASEETSLTASESPLEPENHSTHLHETIDLPNSQETVNTNPRESVKTVPTTVSGSDDGSEHQVDNNNATGIAAIKDEPFTVSFLTSALKVCAGEDVSFINESSNNKATMNWDFGDGSTSTELNPIHSFVLPGNYTVSLLASNGDKQAEH